MKSSLKNLLEFFRALSAELLRDGTLLDRALITMAALGLIAQLAIFSSYLYQSADNRAVIGTRDNDAGVAVTVAIDTQLFNDNGWRPYGPLYYRLVRIARTIAKDPANDAERAHHFLLMLISAAAMGTLALFIASLLTGDVYWRLLMTTALIGAFLADKTWTEMVFRAHPDHLFALIVALATWRTWLWARDPGYRQALLLAGASWGLAAATKMTILMFAPALMLILILPWRGRASLARLRDFGGAALLVYLAIGFPQNFSFAGVISFMNDQNRNVFWGDLETLKGWLALFGAQLWRPLLVLASFSVIVPLRSDTSRPAPPIAYWKLGALIALPLFSLLSRKIISPFYWYPLPFVAALLVAFVIVLARTMEIPSSLASIKQSSLIKLAAFFALPFFQPSLSPELPRRLAIESECRAEAHAVKAIVDKEALNGQHSSYHILVDPLIPYERTFHDKQVLMAWEMSPERITPETSMIALQSKYYAKYLPPEEGGNGNVVLHIRDIEKTRAFYRIFNTLAPGGAEKSEAVDHTGRKWRKTYSDSCSNEIWQRATDSQ